MAFLTQTQIEAIGFRSLGRNVLISEKASIYGAQNISIGDDTRIDDFCILSAGLGGFTIGNNIHISCYASIIGAGVVTVESFCCISGRTSIYSSNDDYSGDFMTGPTLPRKFTNFNCAPVTIRKHTIIGAGCVVLPGVTFGQGCAVAALSLVNKDCAEFGLYAGVPAKRIKDRSHNLLELEKDYLASRSDPRLGGVEFGNE